MMKKSKNSQNIADVRRHSRQLVRELDVVKGVYLGTGYTFSQCHVLFELATHQKLGLLELAENLLIDKSNASRTVKQLIQKDLVKSRTSTKDSRQKLFSLTAKGKKALKETIHLADEQVGSALEVLTAEQQETVVQGLRLYGEALRKSRLQSQFVLRKIRKADNSQIARVIRTVMTEFDAVGEGYSINDPEVDVMHANYRGDKACYYVITKDDKVVGGGGVAPLRGGAANVCEIRKMFFLPQTRGCGLGSKLLGILLDEARARGFSKCYLETLVRMESAKTLYEKFGFQPLKKPMGNTGHCSCDLYYSRTL